MSQYDFGVIDPTIRDGAWLADALNQWRDSLYSMNSDVAAPAYAVDGLLWRDTVNGTAKTTIKQMQAGVWRELWSFDSTGKVKFANTISADQGVIDTMLHLTATPLSLWTNGSIGIGAAGGFDTSYGLHIRNPMAAILLTSTAANGQSNVVFQAPWRTYSLINDPNLSVFGLWNWARGAYDLTVSGATSALGINCIPAATITAFHAYTGGGGTYGLLQTGGHDQARIAYQNDARSWCAGNIGDEWQVWDLTAGAKRSAIDGNGNFYAAFSGAWGSFSNLSVSGTTNLGAMAANTISGNYIVSNGHIDAQTYVWAGQYVQSVNVYASGRLLGGAGGAGCLQSHTTTNLICFRWDGTNLYARIDEVLEIRLQKY